MILFSFGAMPVAQGVVFLIAQGFRGDRWQKIRKVGDKGQAGEGAGAVVARAWSINGRERVRKGVRSTAGAKRRRRRGKIPQARGLGGSEVGEG